MKYLLVLTLLITTYTCVFSQKYGYSNAGNLVAAMPATKAADTKLIALRDSLETVVKGKADQWRIDAQKFQSDYQGGTLTPVQAEEMQNKLAQRQQQILAMEQSIPQAIEARRVKLIAPILAEIQTAIEAIAKEQGYSMIFDTSSFNTVLFSDEALDITNLIKAKLNIQ